MTMLTIKFRTEDLKRALEIVEDRRNRGYDAWIEDESGKIVDERDLKNNKYEPIKATLRETAAGLLVLLAIAVVGFSTVYAIELWAG